MGGIEQRRVVAVGASAGGVEALTQLASGLPRHRRANWRGSSIGAGRCLPWRQYTVIASKKAAFTWRYPTISSLSATAEWWCRTGPPDASRAPFPHRSPRRSSANAACGGLKPPTAGRLRRAKAFISCTAPCQEALPTNRTPLHVRGTRRFSVSAAFGACVYLRFRNVVSHR
jgi:hypothetical protein